MIDHPWTRRPSARPLCSMRPTRAWHVQDLEALESRTLLSGAALPGVLGRSNASALLASDLTRGPGAAEAATFVQAKGFVKSAEAVNSTTMRVQFKSPISRQLAGRLRYSIPGLEVRDVQMARDGRSALLTTSPQDGMGYSAMVRMVQGNGSRIRVIKQASASFTGKPAAKILEITPTSDTTIRVAYSQPMSAAATLASSYLLTGEGAQPVQVTGARFTDPTSRIVELQTTPQSYGSYTINTFNLTDAAGQQVYFDGRKFTGNPRGAVISVAATSSTRVVVAFNEPMADNALAPQHYIIKDAAGKQLPVTEAKFDGPLTMVVVLTTAAQSDVDYRLTVLNVTDLQNDPLKTNTGSFDGIAGPALAKAVPTQSNRVVLTFNGPVGDSALAPSTYQIEQLDDSGNVIGTLPIGSARFIGGQRTVVELQTGTQAEARYRVTTTTALTDVAGTPLPSATVEIQGLGSRPTLVGATSTGASTVLLTFSRPMSDDALSPSSFSILNSAGDSLYVLSAKFVGTERRVLELTTEAQVPDTYTIDAVTATSVSGQDAVVPPDPSINTFTSRGVSGETADIAGPPRVVGAASLSNTELLVVFSEPMADNALQTENYVIVQQNVFPESGTLLIVDPRPEFYQGNRSVVKLTTRSQNELTYQVTVTGVTDRVGNALAPRTISNGVMVNPTSAQFPGTPPSGEHPVDTDGDGLTDSQELRGWVVNIRLLDGSLSSRTVTSDPKLTHSDGDKLTDYEEAKLGLDPRLADTDADQLTDYQEYNEIYSNPLAVDSDGDTLDDSLEFNFFKTSPVFADTDGDQFRDDAEIFGNRNPRVSDLPRPEIEVGAINLQLDVRFSESNARESRDLETRSVSTSLTASESQSLSRQHTAKVEYRLEAGVGDGSSSVGVFVRHGLTAGYTFQQTEESTSAMERSYENSLETQQEVTSGFSVQRQVVGAVMQATVNLRNVSNLAYRVKNLQVTAFIQDPQDRTQLVPVATLVPDHEPEDGFALGPLVTNRGPLIFSNSSIVPTLVESLMANSSGLIFRISNYDIINEDNRNFAFVSQDVVERTGQVIIDFGGARSLRAQVSGEPIDENLPGDETEIHQVSTSAGQVIDTDFDGDIDDRDRVASFDAHGKEVGITLFESLAAIGLEHFEVRFDAVLGRYIDYVPGESTPVNSSLPTEQERILNSYSTFVDVDGRERVFRIRGVSNDLTIEKYWEILTPQGIDQQTSLSDMILKTDAPISLNFVQDLDGDLLPADVEYLLRTSDSPEQLSDSDPTPRGRDTDSDGLDDRFEALIGWTVSTSQRTYTVYSSPTRKDSNFDTPKAGVDSDGDGLEDRLEYDGSDGNVAPAGWSDNNGNGLRDRFEVFQVIDGAVPDLVLDPIRRDTDGDGLSDATELVGFQITRIESGAKELIERTDPLSPFSDSDTFTDAFEKLVGLDPTDGEDTDEDGDGLPDLVETTGWLIGKEARIAEIQTVTMTTTSAVPVRSFSLHYGNEASSAANTTFGLSSDSSAFEVQSALNGLPIIRQLGGHFLVDLSWTASGGGNNSVFRFTYTIRFEGGLLGMDHPPLIGTGGVSVSTVQDGYVIPDFYLIEGVSLRPYAQGIQIGRLGQSRTDSVDSDNDGLSDFEEFFLRSDPLSKDTDGDGIDDRVEVLGYSLGHKVGAEEIGIIKTDLLDADSDNDMRSDGDEAELVDVELKRWVVRATGTVSSGEASSSTAYRAYSHPLVADADFDGLVDGEEFFGLAGAPVAYRTDPNNANTDGDKRNDGVEVRGNLNPLIEDIRITVVAEYIDLVQDGDSDTFSELTTILRVRQPDESGLAGLSQSKLVDVLNAYNPNIDDRGPWIDTDGDGDLDGPGSGISDRYYFSRDTYNLPISRRSYSFGLAQGQRFSVEGIVREDDAPNRYQQFDFGGLDGIRAFRAPMAAETDPAPPTNPDDWVRTIFSYEDLSGKSLEQYYFRFDADEFPTTTVGDNDFGFKGEFSFYILID